MGAGVVLSPSVSSSRARTRPGATSPTLPAPTSNLNELQAVRRIRKAHVSAVSQPYFRRSEAGPMSIVKSSSMATRLTAVRVACQMRISNLVPARRCHRCARRQHTLPEAGLPRTVVYPVTGKGSAYGHGAGPDDPGCPADPSGFGRTAPSAPAPTTDSRSSGAGAHRRRPGAPLLARPDVQHGRRRRG